MVKNILFQTGQEKYTCLNIYAEKVKKLNIPRVNLTCINFAYDQMLNGPCGFDVFEILLE